MARKSDGNVHVDGAREKDDVVDTVRVADECTICVCIVSCPDPPEMRKEGLVF